MVRDLSDCDELAAQAIKRGSDQTHQELRDFLFLLDRMYAEVFLEIGYYRGGTAWAFQQLDDCVVVSIDTKEHEPIEGITLIKGCSQDIETYQKVEDALLFYASVDVLFIDGDHHYESCRKDHDMYAPLVREGGIIAIHDICNLGLGLEVLKCWEEIKKTVYHYGEITYSKQNRKKHGIGYYYKGKE